MYFIKQTYCYKHVFCLIKYDQQKKEEVRKAEEMASPKNEKRGEEAANKAEIAEEKPVSEAKQAQQPVDLLVSLPLLQSVLRVSSLHLQRVSCAGSNRRKPEIHTLRGDQLISPCNL